MQKREGKGKEEEEGESTEMGSSVKGDKGGFTCKGRERRTCEEGREGKGKKWRERREDI